MYGIGNEQFGQQDGVARRSDEMVERIRARSTTWPCSAATAGRQPTPWPGCSGSG